MEFTRRFPNPPSRPPHEDTMMVTRDALLSQLQKDRLRQEIIMAELAQIECAMALRSASVDAESAIKPAPFDFDEQFMTHGTGTVSPERHAGVGKANDLKKEDGVRRRKGKQSKERHVTVDGFVTASSKASSSTCKPAGAQKNLTRDDEGKSQESSEATKSPFMKWSCAICRVEATSAGNLLQHFSGQKHRANIDALKAKAEAEKSRKATQCAAKSCPPWMCMFCHANCTGKPDLESHLNGRRHRAKIQALLEECESMGRDFASSREADSRSSITSQDDEKPASESICGICQVKWSCQSVMEGHVGGKKHRKNFQALQLEAKRLGIIQPEVTKKQETWVCKFCPANCTGKSVLENHLKGKKHHRKIQALLEECKSMTQDHALAEAGSNPNMDEGKPDSVLICGICKVKCVSASVKESHVRGKKHQINLQALHLEAKRLGIVPPKVAKNQQAPPE